MLAPALSNLPVRKSILYLHHACKCSGLLSWNNLQLLFYFQFTTVEFQSPEMIERLWNCTPQIFSQMAVLPVKIKGILYSAHSVIRLVDKNFSIDNKISILECKKMGLSKISMLLKQANQNNLPTIRLGFGNENPNNATPH